MAPSASERQPALHGLRPHRTETKPPSAPFEAAAEAARLETEGSPENPQAWRRLGDALRDLWRLPEAEAAFARATTLAPEDATAWAGLGSVQIVRGRLDAGLASCRTASRLRSDLAAPHRYRATALMAAGRMDDAARAATEARRLDPLAAENRVVLATVWFNAGLRAGATRLIDRVVAEHPGNAEALLARAVMRIESGGIDEGESDLSAALAVKPWLAPAHAALAHLRREQQHPADALSAIEGARKYHPESEVYLLSHLDLLEATKQPSDALRLAEDQLRAHPTSRMLRLRLAMFLLGDGRLEQALRHIPAVLPTTTEDKAWEILASTWQALGRDQERRTCLERALAAGAGQTAAVSLAQAQMRLGDLEGALARLDGLSASAQVLILKSEVLAALGRGDDALAALNAAVTEAPQDALAHMRLGILHRGRREFEAAERELRRTVELVPAESVAHEQLAVLLSETGRFEEAHAELQRGLDIAPGHRSLRFNVAVLLSRQKRWAEAERGLREAIAAAPLSLNAIGNLGRVLAEQQRHEESADVFEQAIEMTPRDPGARHGLLNALRMLRRFDEVVKGARKWIADCPDDPYAWRALALSLAQQGEQEAEAAADRVDQLAADSTISYETRGMVALGLGRAAEALKWFDKGLEQSPDQVSLIVNRSLALDEVSGLEAARAELQRALTLEPGSETAQLNLSMVSLRLGQFAEGWRNYEVRQSALRGPKTLIEAKKASNGRLDLSRAAVLVRAEQGLGDTIHFMRYIAILAAEAREVTFQVQDAIAWMAWGIAPNVRICGYRDPVPTNFDHHVSLISLPGYYDTDLATIPGAVPYVTPDAARVETWRARLGSEGFKVGIVWHTNPAHGNIKRWIPLRRLAPLAAIPGVRLISLQKHYGLDQLTTLTDEGIAIESLGESFDEGPDAFADTAAVIASLDLVIAIDTSICHLAGAIGTPVWVLLHRSSDWRWLTGRTDSPWYPTLRIFQQTVSGDWTGVAEAVRARLLEEVARH
ncbi:MAG: tetratricopeptide repeat protein [Vicinamibacterales bacterium]